MNSSFDGSDTSTRLQSASVVAHEGPLAAASVAVPVSTGTVAYAPADASGTDTVSAAATAASTSRRFFVLLGLVTLLPLIGMPLYSMFESARFPGGLVVLAITGPMHVAASSFFYADREFWPVLRESPLRCFWSLAWAPLGMLAAGLLVAAAIGGPWAQMIVVGLQSLWLFYHYQRQNFGLISFVSTSVGCGRVPPRVDTALNVAALGAWISMIGVKGFCYHDQLLPIPIPLILWRGGTLVYIAAALLLASTVYREPRLRQNLWLTGALVIGLAFFLPAFWFRDLALAFVPYATAHGAQYILMMSVLSGRSSRGWMALLTMCILAVTLGYAIDFSRGWPVVLALTGFVQVHFLLDAKVWRLREPRQRAIMNDRFDFLLAR